MTHNDRFLKALRREEVDRTPVWIMRQAGRYLPEYRKVRAQAGSFLDLCDNPVWAAEVTLQPVTRFPFDASILFSDILILPRAMGASLSFQAGEGPRFAHPVRSQADLKTLRLGADMVQKLGPVYETIDRIQTRLAGRIPLIGFCGSPWTVACYVVEGSGSKDFYQTRSLLYTDPTCMEHLIELLVQGTIEHLLRQIQAGVNAVMLFDTWGSVLAPQAYLKHALAPMQSIVQALKAKHPDIPVILFSKGAVATLEQQAATGCDALGLDWCASLSEARKRVGHQVALQGNLDPALLKAPLPVLEEGVRRLLADFGAGPGHVFNLGHGINPDVDPEQVGALLEMVSRLSAVA